MEVASVNEEDERGSQADIKWVSNVKEKGLLSNIMHNCFNWKAGLSKYECRWTTSMLMRGLLWSSIPSADRQKRRSPSAPELWQILCRKSVKEELLLLLCMSRQWQQKVMMQSYWNRSNPWLNQNSEEGLLCQFVQHISPAFWRIWPWNSSLSLAFSQQRALGFLRSVFWTSVLVIKEHLHHIFVWASRLFPFPQNKKNNFIIWLRFKSSSATLRGL